MNLPTSLKLTWIFTLALAVKLLPEPGSGCHEIADNRILSTNPRGAPEPNVTWKEPGMKFTYRYIYIHMYIHIHYTQDIHIHPCIDYSIHIATGVKPQPHPPILPAAQATETEFDDDEGPPDGDAACHSSLAFGDLAPGKKR